MKNKKQLNLFFSVDDGYCKFLSVTLDSIAKHTSDEKNTAFNVYVLSLNLNEECKNKLKKQIKSFKNFKITFVNMEEKLKTFGDLLFTRDFYNKTIYYRLFIPTLFPNLDKALYLDSDIIFLDDVSKLYETELEDNLVGAIADEVTRNSQIIRDYATKCLGINCADYFNSGVLLMNLKKLREFDFEKKFFDLFTKYKFRVAPDQDCLNVLCKEKIKFIDFKWNKMPIKDSIYQNQTPSLVHFNLIFKPWQFDDVQFCQHFWELVDNNVFKNEIYETKNKFTEQLRQKSLSVGDRIYSIAIEEISNPQNYRNLVLNGKI